MLPVAVLMLLCVRLTQHLLGLFVTVMQKLVCLQSYLQPSAETLLNKGLLHVRVKANAASLDVCYV